MTTRIKPEAPETVIALFRRAVEQHADQPAMRRKRDGHWETLTYRELAEMAERFAGALLDRGFSAGEKVAILAENRLEWALTDLGTLMVRGVDVPLYPTLSSKQVAHILAHCEARILVVSTATQLAKVASVADSIATLRLIVVMAGQLDELPCKTDVVSFEAFLAQGARYLAETGPSDLETRQMAIEPTDLASLIYTSGTTGEPKGVMLTHRNFVTNAITVKDLVTVGPTDMTLSFLPLSHVLERLAYHGVMSVGGTIAFAESVDAVPQNLMEVAPTILVSVPRLFEKMHAKVLSSVTEMPPGRQRLFNRALRVGMAYWEARDAGKVGWGLTLAYRIFSRLVFAKIRARTGGRLRYAVCGGAPLAREVERFFRAIGVPLFVGYGLTETSPVVTCNYPGHARLGSVGMPIPGVRVKVAPDGEVWVQGPNVMAGYYKRPDLTEESIVDGWLRTGDVGYQDEDGYLFLTDRKKDLLVMSNGKNVAPAPIEAALCLSPWIGQAVVVGERRNFVSALIVPDFEQLSGYARAHGLAGGPEAWCRDPGVRAVFQTEIDRQLADFAQFEKVKTFTLIAREFSQDMDELTPTLKVKRRKVLDHFGAEVDAMYARAAAEVR